MRVVGKVSVEIELALDEFEGTVVHASRSIATLVDGEDEVGQVEVSSGGVYLTPYEAALASSRGALGALLGESDEIAIDRLCRRYGFENVVRTAAALWARSDPSGALSVASRAAVSVEGPSPDPTSPFDLPCPENPDDGRHRVTVPSGGGRACRACGISEGPR